MTTSHIGHYTSQLDTVLPSGTGRDWLLATQGTDITEVFESSHLTSLPHNLLLQYLVGDAHTPRNSPYTFYEDGFFKTFRKKVGRDPPLW